MTCVFVLLGWGPFYSRGCLCCWFGVGFITCVFVLLGCGRFYHVCVCLVGLGSVLSHVCLSC